MEKGDLLVAVLEHYGATHVPTHRLAWAAMRCPFHDDKQASASVNYVEGAYKCHGCTAIGDAYALIMQEEGCDFARAVELAEEIAGVSHGTLRKKRGSSRPVFGRPRDLKGQRPLFPSGRSR